MNTLSLELTGVKEVDLPVIETILKKFKIKSKVVKQEKDDTKMTKEAFYQMIDKRSKEKEGVVLKSEQEINKFFEEWV